MFLNIKHEQVAKCVTFYKDMQGVNDNISSMVNLGKTAIHFSNVYELPQTDYYTIYYMSLIQVYLHCIGQLYRCVTPSNEITFYMVGPLLIIMYTTDLQHTFC
jgi:hypothetical protein